MLSPIELNCKAFRGEGPRKNHIMVEDDGTIRVYDNVAGYYTTMHSLSKNAVEKIMKDHWEEVDES